MARCQAQRQKGGVGWGGVTVLLQTQTADSDWIKTDREMDGQMDAKKQRKKWTVAAWDNFACQNRRLVCERKRGKLMDGLACTSRGVHGGVERETCMSPRDTDGMT